MPSLSGPGCNELHILWLGDYAGNDWLPCLSEGEPPQQTRSPPCPGYEIDPVDLHDLLTAVKHRDFHNVRRIAGGIDFEAWSYLGRVVSDEYRREDPQDRRDDPQQSQSPSHNFGCCGVGWLSRQWQMHPSFTRYRLS